MVFPALYNGPVNYYARLVRQKEIVLEQHENYSKQTYRNRCLIMGPNGVIPLSIPVKRKSGIKTLFRDIRIDYDTPWNQIHWRSLVASYASSPFFEFLADEIRPFYQKKSEFLIDLNLQLVEQSLNILGLDIPLSCSDSFSPISAEHDPRDFIHPKKDQATEDPAFHPPEYHQVFSDRLGFCPNLSILDLIFNLGPDALSYLQRSLRT
ncbi:MAG: WbqC family protein [Bacteroidales bacterium]|nr:WbqC family protein [Bacteroidales bacterium]